MPKSIKNDSEKSVSVRDADATRTRIFEAAKIHFSQRSYDGVGVREIAADAHADPALVIRYFGSKEGLFREVAAQAFGIEELIQGDIAKFPEHAVQYLTGEIDNASWRAGYDPFRLLLCSISSATAGPIISEYFASRFILPLSEALPGNARQARAILLASHVLGFALVRLALASPGLGAEEQDAVQALLGNALQNCVQSKKKE